MELERYLINFKVNFQCVTRKGIFKRKKESFSYAVSQNEIIIASDPFRAITIGKKKIQKRIDYLVAQVEHLPTEKHYLFISNEKAELSPRVYEITEANFEIVNVAKI